MICKHCAIGADLVTQLNSVDEVEVTGENDFVARDFIRVARTLHGFCKGCDCQHHIVNRKGQTIYHVPNPRAPFFQITPTDGASPPLKQEKGYFEQERTAEDGGNSPPVLRSQS